MYALTGTLRCSICSKGILDPRHSYEWRSARASSSNLQLGEALIGSTSLCDLLCQVFCGVIQGASPKIQYLDFVMNTKTKTKTTHNSYSVNLDFYKNVSVLHQCLQYHRTHVVLHPRLVADLADLAST